MDVNPLPRETCNNVWLLVFTQSPCRDQEERCVLFNRGYFIPHINVCLTNMLYITMTSAIINIDTNNVEVQRNRVNILK